MIHYKSSTFMMAFYRVFPVTLGSAVFSVHCLSHASAAAALTVAIERAFDDETLEGLIRHPSVYFSSFASCLSFLLVYRANLAYQRYWEANTRITQMTTKLRDVSVQVATFVQSNDTDAASWKSTQLRRLALYNALALMELREGRLNLQDYVQEGILTEDEVPVLQATGNKPALVMVWLVDAWVVREKAGKVDVPAPVLSRSFQLLSEVSLEREQIHKIKATPFPFPYAQACSFLLLFWLVSLPVVVATFVEPEWLAATISFLGVLSLFSINGVSSELECPFDDTPNDLSLEYYKDDFTDAMAETMSWLSDDSEGNVAGSIAAAPDEKPWAMLEKQLEMRERVASQGKVGREKDAGSPESTRHANPTSTKGTQLNFIPEEVRMRVTRSWTGRSELEMSTLDEYRRKKGIFWLH
jgi:predicted membrane chloride channel (bestrophin family)